MAEMFRLFIAVELPTPVVNALSDLRAQLVKIAPPRSVRWVRPEGIHLTLKFLGDTPADRRRDIERGMAQAAQAVAGRAPFSVTVGELGCFPNFSRPRVVWVGIGGALDALHALRDAIEATIAPLGYPTESRAFSPHLTLGRVSKSASRDEVAALGRALQQVKVGVLGEVAVDAISLIRSQLRPDGAVYTQLAHIQLEAADG